MKRLILSLSAVVALAGASTALAITWGVPDVNNEYPNVASVRGVVLATNTARVSCSGSLLYRDSTKIVVLTAAHCTDGWKGALAAGTIDTVGVSFDQNNQVPDPTDPSKPAYANGTYYVRGGVPISFPAKDAPFEKFDYGLVVFPVGATNRVGQTIDQRWPGLAPVQVAPDTSYVSSLIAAASNPTQTLRFTAVGYGTGEKFPIPSQQTGPATPSGSNDATFPIRYIGAGMGFDAHNPVNDVLRLSMNIAQGESGTCNGDSGGPIFYNDPARGRVQVSLVSGGDYPCRATNTGPGFSRQEAFDFLGCARVPGGASAVVACVANRFGA